MRPLRRRVSLSIWSNPSPRKRRLGEPGQGVVVREPVEGGAGGLGVAVAAHGEDAGADGHDDQHGQQAAATPPGQAVGPVGHVGQGAGDHKQRRRPPRPRPRSRPGRGRPACADVVGAEPPLLLLAIDGSVHARSRTTGPEPQYGSSYSSAGRPTRVEPRRPRPDLGCRRPLPGRRGAERQRPSCTAWPRARRTSATSASTSAQPRARRPGRPGCRAGRRRPPGCPPPPARPGCGGRPRRRGPPPPPAWRPRKHRSRYGMPTASSQATVSPTAMAWPQLAYRRWVTMRIHTPASLSRHSASAAPATIGMSRNMRCSSTARRCSTSKSLVGQAPLVEVPASAAGPSEAGIDPPLGGHHRARRRRRGRRTRRPGRRPGRTRPPVAPRSAQRRRRRTRGRRRGTRSPWGWRSGRRPRSVTTRASARRSASGSAGTGEVPVADDHQHRAGDPGQALVGDGRRRRGAGRRPAPPGRCRARGPGPGSTGPPGSRRRASSSARSMESASTAALWSGRNRLAPTPASTRRWKRSGWAAASTSRVRAPSEKPDGVDRLVGEVGQRQLLELVVGLRVVGLGRRRRGRAGRSPPPGARRRPAGPATRSRPRCARRELAKPWTRTMGGYSRIGRSRPDTNPTGLRPPEQSGTMPGVSSSEACPAGGAGLRHPARRAHRCASGPAADRAASTPTGPTPGSSCASTWPPRRR